jgi:hypothetical protein
MGFKPQRASHCRWVNPGLPPPSGFITAAVDLAMVAAIQRDNKLVADLASESPALRKAQMMGI